MTEDELMLTALLNCDRTALYSQRPQLTPQQETMLSLYRARRKNHEPLQYILGMTDFYGLKIKVDERVLIPRPETELLVEHLLELITREATSQVHILDIGTGSGNISIALAKSLHSARLTALDISPEALTLARYNAQRHHVAHAIDFIHLDFFEFAKNYREAEKRFDIIVSNPPYIPTSALDQLPQEVKREPVLALDGGKDGTKFYHVLIEAAQRCLKPGGFLACEIGDSQKDSVTQLLVENQIKDFYFQNDYRNTPRYFVARI